MKIVFRIFITLFISFCSPVFSQGYRFEVAKTITECERASALIVGDSLQVDSLTISWSTGEIGFTGIKDLFEGDYSVHINIKNKFDSTLYFTVEKIFCRVSIASHFTPNGDDYNDYLSVVHSEDYPNFELEIYNKWGQRVHAQKEKYTPWDGRSSGINVPDGTYYYVFFYDAANKRLLIKGSVTILR